ncbi:MAG TPA: hypothetical protein VIR54_14540, partial [Vicinamibacterales bacterium]
MASTLLNVVASQRHVTATRHPPRLAPDLQNTRVRQLATLLIAALRAGERSQRFVVFQRAIVSPHAGRTNRMMPWPLLSAGELKNAVICVLSDSLYGPTKPPKEYGSGGGCDTRVRKSTISRLRLLAV